MYKIVLSSNSIFKGKRIPLCRDSSMLHVHAFLKSQRLGGAHPTLFIGDDTEDQDLSSF